LLLAFFHSQADTALVVLAVAGAVGVVGGMLYNEWKGNKK